MFLASLVFPVYYVALSLYLSAKTGKTTKTARPAAGC
jgi:hypothetical protein